MKKITFVFPPYRLYTDIDGGFTFKLGLGAAYCISYLVQQGFPAGPFVTDKPVNVDACVKQILAEEPEAVGFTVYDTNYSSCQLIARSLKKAVPGIIIIFGGPTASVQAKSILEMNDFVDICVRHEGEETCRELLTLLDNLNFQLKKTSAAAALEKIKGITYRADHMICENPPRDILFVNRKSRNFLDKYPSPYLNGLLNSCEPGIITSRGCNCHCTFCDCAVISNRIISTHSTDRVIEELDYISKKIGCSNGGHVDILDDTFTLLRGRALEICRKIIENKIKLPLSCSTRCDKIDEELLEKMKEAGFNSISFSLESAVPRLLRLIGKVHPPATKADPNLEKEKEFIEKFKKYTVFAKKIGIKSVIASIMIGLPSETKEEGQQTADLIQSLGENLDSYAHNIFQALPGTPVFYNHEPMGIKLVPLDNHVHYKTIHTYDTASINPAPRSHQEIVAASQDRFSIKSLALAAPAARTAGFFLKVILWSDIISRDFISWLQDYLAVNGALIQVYSSLDSARRYHENNRHNLYKYIAPTLFHPVFYQTGSKHDTITLIPFGREVDSKHLGLAIKLVKTTAGLLPGCPGMNPAQALGIDREKQDVLQLHRFLVRLSENGSAARELFNTPFTPYFSTLCRWERWENKIPNCRSLETVFIDSHNQVKTCWNAAPIGEVGMPFNDLWENLERIHQSCRKKRDCPNCPKQVGCAGCIFPDPLSDCEYCDLKKNSGTAEPVDLIRTLDSFKEL